MHYIVYVTESERVHLAGCEIYETSFWHKKNLCSAVQFCMFIQKNKKILHTLVVVNVSIMNVIYIYGNLSHEEKLILPFSVHYIYSNTVLICETEIWYGCHSKSLTVSHKGHCQLSIC